ncbi:MAG: acyl-CoA reductase [Eubacteriales bacterium]|nr:acyl-CoA reductase [Eubacteriales bacterium]
MSSGNQLHIRVLCGLADPREAASAPALPPFDPRVMAFLADLSAALLKDKRVKAYPDVTTFAFFCRRANLENLRKPYASLSERVGRGLTFHIAPGNVPMNFAYSLVAALLAGNACVVKASSRDFEQTAIVCDAMRALLAGKHVALLPYVNVIAYPREAQATTEAFSALCDVRVIWGGNETIRRVRQAPLAPRAFDVAFADRWSALVADAAFVAAMDDKALAAAAQGFYNDTYLFDQNACTSPKLIYWLGEGDVLQKAQERFWTAVYAYAVPRYPIDPVTAVDKRMALYRAALTLPEATLAPMPDHLAVRIRLGALTPAVTEFPCSGGCFLEYAAAELGELAPLLTQKAQTLSVLGVEPQTVQDFVLRSGVRGVDRVVPVGRTLDFALVWDGFDLIETLSRRVTAG